MSGNNKNHKQCLWSSCKKNDYRQFLESSNFWDKNFGQQATEEEATREDVDLDGRKTMGLRETEFECMD